MHRLVFLVLTCAVAAGCSDGPGEKEAPPPSTPSVKPKAPDEKLEPVTIGGLKAQKFGQIYLGGQPNAEDLARFKEAGVKTVVNVREEGENQEFMEAAVLADLGIDYHNPAFDSPQTLSAPIFRRVRDLLANEENAPLLLHCASGNRVGAVWMAHRVLDHGVPYDIALEEAQAIGMKPAYEVKVKEYIESKPE